MSFSLHSSTENFGGGRRSGSVGSNSSSRLSCPVKSSMGLMSLKVSARPRSRNHWNESRWMATRSGRGRASSRLANEKRSGLWDREVNRPTPPNWVPNGETTGYCGNSDAAATRAYYQGHQSESSGSTATAEAAEGGAGARVNQPKRSGRRREQARQPVIIPGGAQDHNPRATSL